jgi:hypothetical protein
VPDRFVARTFLALVMAQAAHSVEEYVFRLYDVFAPARFISSIVSDNLARGFLATNVALVSFGIWCYTARVRTSHPSATGWVWLWIAVEFGNGIGHLTIALARRAYFPGAATAPVLLVLSIALAVRLLLGRSPRGLV